MRTWKKLIRGPALLSIGCLFILAISNAAQKEGAKNPSKDVPVYKVDPFWPKPLPNHWIMQGVPVMVVDKDDHIWVMNRPRDANPDEAESLRVLEERVKAPTAPAMLKQAAITP